MIRVEVVGEVGVVTLCRPQALNALHPQMLKELLEYFQTNDHAAIVLAGEGKAFSAGADLNAMLEMDVEGIAEYLCLGNEVMETIASSPSLVAAAVHGYALGGGLELALACDRIVGDVTAKVGLPEVTLGLVPAFGGTQRLPARVGMSKGRELIFTGKKIGCKEALAIGLFDQAAQEGEAANEAIAWLEEVLQHPKDALAGVKRALSGGFREEQQAFYHCFALEETRKKLEKFRK